MNPKEKAKELVEKFSQVASFNDLSDGEEAKFCAFVCADEIMNSRSTNYTIEVLEYLEYWKQALIEIDKL